MEIIRPEEKYFLEYYQACKESHENQVTEWMPFELDHFDTWKANILDAYARYEEGRDLPAGLPRTVTRWGVEGDTFIGELQVRPYLTEEEAKTWGHIAYAVRHSQTFSMEKGVWNQTAAGCTGTPAAISGAQYLSGLPCRESGLHSRRAGLRRLAFRHHTG